MNPLNTTLEFDVLLYGSGADTDIYTVHFQNNIQTLFSRVRLLYGSTPLEDIINYNVVVRNLTEWTGSTWFDQNSIADGIGGVTTDVYRTTDASAGVTPGYTPGLVHVRKSFIQGIDFTRNTTNATAVSPDEAVAIVGTGYVPNKFPAQGSTPAYTVRRYQINFALGLFTQDKLVVRNRDSLFRSQLNSWLPN